jgi:hypothetical protein
MLNLWSDGPGTIAGILLGIAIPLQAALRTRRVIDVVVMQRTQEIHDAFDAIRQLAEQAVCGLSCTAQLDLPHDLKQTRYFATTYNRSHIEHALKRVEATAASEPTSYTADFVAAAAHARISMRQFFDELFTASDHIDAGADTPENLRRLFDTLTDDISSVDAARHRLVKAQ